MEVYRVQRQQVVVVQASERRLVSTLAPRPWHVQVSVRKPTLLERQEAVEHFWLALEHPRVAQHEKASEDLVELQSLPRQ